MTKPNYPTWYYNVCWYVFKNDVVLWAWGRLVLFLYRYIKKLQYTRIL
jgi:hypothetical protein